MKLIIAGSRTITDWAPVYEGIKKIPYITTEVVCGGAQGVDFIGAVIADLNNIPVKMFNADWKTHGKAAGPIRNRQMAQYADHLLLVWDGKSRGSANMKLEMEKLGKPITEVIVGKVAE